MNRGRDDVRLSPYAHMPQELRLALLRLPVSTRTQEEILRVIQEGARDRMRALEPPPPSRGADSR